MLKHVKLGVANAFTFLTPVFGMAIGMVWFGERFTATDAVGGTLIFLGLIVVSRASGDGHEELPVAVADGGRGDQP